MQIISDVIEHNNIVLINEGIKNVLDFSKNYKQFRGIISSLVYFKQKIGLLL